MNTCKRICIALSALSLLACFDVTASASPIGPFCGGDNPGPAANTERYRLHNHPDGVKAEPYYGLRLDGLLTLDDDDVYTFDFDAPESAMFMDVSSTSIHIYGQAFGGRDVGDHYSFRSAGVWLIDFLYDTGVGLVGGDGGFPDIRVTGGCSMSNSGTIQKTFGRNRNPIPLVDKCNMQGFSFQFGDENGGGHRNFDGLSGWGWLNHNGLPHMESSDFLFTAEKIPEPTSLALLCTGLPLLMSRRRRGNR